MDFEAILGQIMELAGPLIQMCIQICTQIVQAISSALGEGGGLKAGAAATLIGGAVLTTGALQPGQTPGAPGAPTTTTVAQASPANPPAPATTQPNTIGLAQQGATAVNTLAQGN